MKKVFCILLVICFMGCEKSPGRPVPTEGQLQNSPCYVTIIDGCEYIYCDARRAGKPAIAITPKLNQKNSMCGGK
jgi:hypothetical protein